MHPVSIYWYRRNVLLEVFLKTQGFRIYSVTLGNARERSLYIRNSWHYKQRDALCFKTYHNVPISGSISHF